MKDSIRVTNIQRMCFHDGPGIRTTVFVKGCSLNCPWCSNPENINFLPEKYDVDSMENIYGEEYSVDDIVSILIKDRRFWEKDGGVTFSGGEALLQAGILRDILKRLKGERIHTAVETALFVPIKNVEMVLPYIDYFIVDVKILDAAQCKKILGGDLSLYLKNVELLCKANKLKIFRVPCCPEYTFTEENKILLLKFFEYYRSVPVQLFKIHELGEKKYMSLRRKMWKSKGVSKEELIAYCEILKRHGISAEVISI